MFYQVCRGTSIESIFRYFLWKYQEIKNLLFPLVKCPIILKLKRNYLIATSHWVDYLFDCLSHLFGTLLPRKLQLLFLSTKISFIIGGKSPFKNLYVSIANIIIFLWCIVAELSLLRNFWKDELILNSLLCILFILLLWLQLYNIQINGQYPYCDSM